MKLDVKLLGAAIKNARMEKKITQEQLAEMVGITSIHLKQLESGRRKPSIDVLYALSRTLNISVDSIFFPERTDGRDLQNKIERSLSNCSLHELKVIYTTISAMTEKDTQ
ncbi:MAG: helix-turn-helix transcriptional regulator [Clostridiaceae bacterium]|jgi:transcriptional regulator with XRE-family HTH domain|nr:helix-turn-helix transcriptional regulator [Clostridiaceae bacterium]